jgi:arabinogalactan oligomer/maltooligosaccharide transport system permease protein
MFMKKYSDLEYLKLPKWHRFLYTLLCLFVGIPSGIWNFIKSIGKAIAGFGKRIVDEIVDIFVTFKDGDWKTRVSYLIMGFGCLARGQILRGLLFLLMQVVFIVYMAVAGINWMSQLPSLGVLGPVEEYDPVFDQYTTVYHDNSFKILLYGVLTIFFIVALIVTWRMNIKQNKIAQQILASGKKLRSGKDDLRSMVDDQFHKTLLALPMLGIVIFTVMPIVFMILVAFTNYDSLHDGYINNLFDWVGWDNWNTMLSWGDGNVKYGATLGEILAWTIIWAFFATFTNYFLGMGVAMMINKKGIKLKKFWRTCLVLTIAVPQFISLLYVSKMFSANGIVNGTLLELGWIKERLPFWEEASWARVWVIILNIWIGIPHLMLMATGILMNIPADLYESAKIDGAGPWKQYTKITLPYMLFVTGPYLLTSFIGNMNNFNVIYLLTGGGPPKVDAAGVIGAPGEVDLLITWLFKMITTSEPAAYNLASVIGIIVFVVVASISLVVYNVMPSTKNEEDFQ